MEPHEKYWKTVLILIMIVSDIVASCLNDNCNLAGMSAMEPSSKILSRRKRFLVFPEGSSFQLVFCVQTAALIPIGDIFLYSNTAALAWNLPTDPKFFSMLKTLGTGDEAPQRRLDANKHMYLLNEGKVVAKVPYKRKPIINPAFAKRSIDDPSQNTPKRPDMAAVKKWLHEKQSKREFLKKEHWDNSSVRFHRLTRASLFEKLEVLFKALGQRDGRQCVLRHLCRAAQASSLQGTFLDELLRMVYTLPKGEQFENDEHKAYDEAHSEDVDCSALYPDCDDLDILL